MRSIPLRFPVFLAVCSLVPFLAGCAAIIKGSRSSVQLDLPPGTEIKNYTPYLHEVVIRRKDSATMLNLRSGKDYLLEFQAGENRDSMLLTSRLNVGYIVADIFLCWPIALPIDLASDAAYDFEQERVSFPLPPHITSGTDTASPILTIYPETSGRTSLYQRKTDNASLGIVLAFHLGAKIPFNQVPLFGNNVGITAGYRIFPNIALMGYFGGSVLLNYTPPGANIYMEAISRTFAVESRFYPIKNLYATVGIGYLHIEADSLRRTNTTSSQPIPNSGFAQSMPNVSVGAGMAFQGFFFEFRQNFGFEKLQVTETLSAPVRNPELRVGVNLDL